MNAIIYTTNTCSTEYYAKLLAQKTGLPAYCLAEAKKEVFVGAEVIYLGWIMAGSIKGYANVAKRYQVRAVCGVGMGQTGTQTDSVRKNSAIPANIPLFTLQGNFNVKKRTASRVPIASGPQEARFIFCRSTSLFLPPYRSVTRYASAASSRTAWMAASSSSSVLKYEKLKRTAPCFSVPSASCIRGAQCAPGLVAIP